MTTVNCDFFAEGVSGGVFDLWVCLNRATQSGYQLRLAVVGEHSGEFNMTLFRVDAGVYTELDKKLVTEVPESALPLQFAVAEGSVSALFNGTEVSALDGTYTTGIVGMEQEGENDFGLTNFELNGVLLDSFKREEDPLATGKWVSLSWTTGKGKCYNAEFGWVANGEHSGAAWSDAEPPTVSTVIRSGMVPRP